MKCDGHFTTEAKTRNLMKAGTRPLWGEKKNSFNWIYSSV